MRTNPEPFQCFRGNDGVRGAGIDEQLELRPPFRMSGVGDTHTNVRQSHAVILLAKRPFELAEETLIFTPSFMNCDMKVEKDFRAEYGFELQA